jgi:hypothetical protein
VRALPLLDADPASVSLVWSRDSPHPRLQGLLEAAALGAGSVPGAG